jgi:hypothetical protein
MGLLDYLKQGYQNSGLQDLGNSFANQPKMYDPHANAQALMGGQSMQPQSLIAEKPQVDIGQPQVTKTPFEPTQAQQQQVTYNSQANPGVNYPNYDSSSINPYLDGDQTGYVGGYVDTTYNNRVNSPMYSSDLMGNAQTPQGLTGVDSNGSVVPASVSETAITSPYMDLSSQIQEKMSPEVISERQRAYDELVRRGILSPKR